MKVVLNEVKDYDKHEIVKLKVRLQDFLEKIADTKALLFHKFSNNTEFELEATINVSLQLKFKQVLKINTTLEELYEFLHDLENLTKKD